MSNGITYAEPGQSCPAGPGTVLRTHQRQEYHRSQKFERVNQKADAKHAAVTSCKQQSVYFRSQKSETTAMLSSPVTTSIPNIQPSLIPFGRDLQQ
jgi:hypothetical protein